MSHTKGPWRASGTYGMIVTDNLSICQLEVNHNEPTFTFEEYKANAKLIAAAPDLLNACKSAIKILNKDGMHTDLFNELFDAIKKATE